jgi:predicted dehydrogenase
MKVVGVVSSEKEGRDQLARSIGASTYESLADMLPDVDVVDICTPTHLHYEQVMEAVAAGKDIVCEKPLARTAAHAQAILQAVESAGVHLLVGHVVRFFPEYASAKAIVQTGQIGKVAVTRLTRCSFKPARNNPDSWFHDDAKSGGMMLDLMIHDFDYARWVGGEVESVFARRVVSRFADAPGDYALAILNHSNGAISHVEGGWAYPAPMFRTALEIAGSHGLIEHPVNSSVPIGVHLHESNRSDNDIAVPSSPLAQDPYAVQIQHFYDVLTGKETTPRVTGQDGYEALCIALAAIESAKTGRKVRVSEIRGGAV